jgi:hypothetical protein
MDDGNKYQKNLRICHVKQVEQIKIMLYVKKNATD